MLDFLTYLLRQMGQFDARVSALESILDRCTRKLMQNGLHHGELVQIGI